WTNGVGERTIWEARNYVKPVFEGHISFGKLSLYGTMSTPESHAEALAELSRIVATLGAYGTEDGSTLYGEDAHEDFQSGDWYNYALHAHVKRYDATRGYVEDDISIIPEKVGV